MKHHSQFKPAYIAWMRNTTYILDNMSSYSALGAARCPIERILMKVPVASYTWQHCSPPILTYEAHTVLCLLHKLLRRSNL